MSDKTDSKSLATLWWNKVLTTPGKMEDWLKRQFHGEAASVPRLDRLIQRTNFASLGDEWKNLLTIIRNDEAKHAEQVAALLRARGIDPQMLPGYKSRYFNVFQDGYPFEGEDGSFPLQAATGAFAEQFAMTRFEAILAHPETPLDIRKEFESILREEEFHFYALRRLAGPEAMAACQVAHERALKTMMERQ